MAWTSTNPVSIGDPTKKSHYDVNYDNGKFERNATTGAIETTLSAGIKMAPLNSNITLSLLGSGSDSYFGMSLQNTISDSTSKFGVPIVGARHGNSEVPFTAVATLDNGSARVVYMGGGGWNAPDATDFRVYTAPTYNETTNQALLRMTILADGSTGFNEPLPDVDTGGVCLNHGSSDGNVLTFKNSDVAHGMTDFAETDTYVEFKKWVSATGGLHMLTFTEDTTSYAVDAYATAESTSDTTSSVGCITLLGAKKSGTGAVGLGNTANVLAVRNHSNTRFIIKGNGDIHATNTTITALDDHNDAEAVRDLTYHLAPKKWLSRALRYNKKDLHDMGVITVDPNSDDIMMSFQGMFGLYGGAIGELHGVMGLLISKLEKLGISTNYDNLRKEFRDNQPALLV